MRYLEILGTDTGQNVENGVDRSNDVFGAVIKDVGSYHDEISSFDSKDGSWLEFERSSVCWMSILYQICKKNLTEVQKGRVLNII